MKQNSIPSAGAAADSSTNPQVTKSSHNSSKPIVGSSAISLLPVADVWCCISKNNDPNYDTISTTKNGSIEKLIKTFAFNTQMSKWRFWKSKGYYCIKVNIIFSQVNTK